MFFMQFNFYLNSINGRYYKTVGNYNRVIPTLPSTNQFVTIHDKMLMIKIRYIVYIIAQKFEDFYNF